MNFPAIRRIPEILPRIGGTYVEPTLPWEIDKAVDTTETLNASAKDSDILGMEISQDGQELYLLGNTTNTIYQYTLCTAYDLSTAQFADSFSFATETTAATSMRLCNDGTSLLVAAFTGIIYVYQLGTAYDISTAVWEGAPTNIDVTAETTALDGITLSADEDILYALDGTGDVFAYSLSYADPTFTIGASTTVDFGVTTANSEEIQVHGDGKKIFIADGTTDYIYVFDMPIFFSLSGAVYDTVYMDTTGEITTLGAFVIAYDGFSLYAVDNSTSIVYEYSME